MATMAARKPDYLSEPVEPTIEAQWLRSHPNVPKFMHPSYVKWYKEALANAKAGTGDKRSQGDTVAARP